MPAVGRRRWTAKEVRALTAANPLWTPRYELVGGELLVTPSPGPAHQEVVACLLIALRAYLDREHVGHAVMSPSDIELEPETVTQPDLFVVPPAEWRRALRDGFPVHDLVLAVEVVSPSSSRYDRGAKRLLYQRRVGEYWVVDVNARLVERWRRGDTRPEIVTGTLVWTPEGAAATFALALEAMFREATGE